MATRTRIGQIGTASQPEKKFSQIISRAVKRSPERITDSDEEEIRRSMPVVEPFAIPPARSNGSSGGRLIACLILAAIVRQLGGRQ